MRRSRAVVAALTAFVLTLLGAVIVSGAPAVATTLTDMPPPEACPSQWEGFPGSGAPDSWCIPWGDDYGDTPTIIGTFTVHFNPDSDNTLTVPVPGGAGLVFDDGGDPETRYVYGGYLRDPSDNSAHLDRTFLVHKPYCAVHATACQWVWDHDDYPDLSPGAPKPSPVWTFWEYPFFSDNGCCWVGEAGFAIHVIYDAGGPPANPTASFTATPITSTPGQFQFVSTSTDPRGGGLDSTWNFGDGGTATGPAATHTYTKPGSYDVSLTVTDTAGATDTAHQTVTVDAPELGVSIALLDGAAPPLDPDENVRVRVTVSASDDGVGSLSKLRFPDGVLTATPDGIFEPVGPPEPEPPPAGFGLSPGRQQAFVVELTPTALGAYRLATRVVGTDAAGRDVAATASRNGKIGRELTVAITLDPASFTQDEDADGPKPVDVHATITLANSSSGVIDELNLRSLDVERTKPGQPLDVVQIDGVRPDPIEGLPIAGSLGPGEHKDLTATFRVNDDGEIDFSALATGANESGGTVTAFGTQRLSAKPKYLIGLTSRVTTPGDGALLPAGKTITVFGTITNLSNTDELKLGPLFPELSGNAGIASVGYDSTGTDPRALVPPEPLELDPGESKPFTVHVTTTWSDPRTDAPPAESGGTRATLRFTPWGTATDEDGVERDIDPDKQVLASASDLVKTVHIDDSIAIPASDYTGLAAGILRGTIEGVWSAAAATVMGIVDLVKLPYTILRATFEFQSEVWRSFTPEEREAFASDAGLLAAAVLMRNAELGKQGAEELYAKAKASTLKLMTGLADDWATGNYESTAHAYTSAAANAIGSVVIPIALAKLAKSGAVVRALSRAQSALQERMAPVLGEIADLRKVTEAGPVLDALASGTELTAAEIAQLYGISPAELEELQRLATKYKYLLTVRSRHASSIEWIEKAGAMLKPEALKLKSVSDLDVKLGYPSDSVGSLVFKKPEALIAWQRDGGSLGDAVTAFLDSKGFTAGTAEWEEAVRRIGQRMQEWTDFEKKYKQWDKRGWIDVSFNYKGNAIDDTVRKGTGKYLGFKLKKIGPEEYTMLLQDGRTGQYVPITGDIDPIAFTHLDGSPLTAAEHAALLDDVARNPALRAQHGESATFTKGGVDFVLGQFKPGEPGLQIAPGNLAPRAVRLDPGKSRWASPRDFNLHWDGGFTYAGEAAAGPGALPRGPNFDALGDAPSVPAPAAAPHAVTGLSPAGVPNLGRCRMTYSDDPDALALYLATDGTLQQVAADGSVTPAELDCFSPGPIVEVAVTPSTLLATSIPAGDPQELAVRVGPPNAPLDRAGGFQRGQRVLVGAGTAGAELRTVAGFGSVILDRPLDGTHQSGDIVLVVAQHASELGGPVADTGVPVRSFVATGAWLLAIGLVLLIAAGGCRPVRVRWLPPR